MIISTQKPEVFRFSNLPLFFLVEKEAADPLLIISS